MTLDSAALWDFTPIYDILDAFKPPSLDGSPSENGGTPLPLVAIPSLVTPTARRPACLGDFDRVFEFLGLPTEKHRPRHESTGSSSTTRSHHSTPPSSIPDETARFDEFVARVKGVRWTDEVDGTGLADRFDSEPELSSPHPHSAKHPERHRSSLNASAVKFAPLSVVRESASFGELLAPRPKSEGSLWTPPSIPSIQVDPLIIQPIYYLTAEEKRAKLLQKLKANFQVASDSLGYVGHDGIHVFVDCSNIIIGFYNALKIKRGYNIRAYIKQAPMSWHSLALILERGTYLESSVNQLLTRKQRTNYLIAPSCGSAHGIILTSEQVAQ